MTVELTQEEYDTLMLVLGFAAGAASRDDPRVFAMAMRTANAVGRASPFFTPYDLPDENANMQNRIPEEEPEP